MRCRCAFMPCPPAHHSARVLGGATRCPGIFHVEDVTRISPILPTSSHADLIPRHWSGGR